MAKRPKKIVYGDQIQRSEYNDGVLRNNNRANNRLSREMLMYEKAQKVILKDLGKETQLLRSKLSMSTIASPRLAFAKNTTTDIEPFTIYGMSANPKNKKEPARKVTLKPIYPSVVEGSATPRASFNPRTSFVSPRNHVVVSSSSRNGLVDSRVEKVNSRNGLLDSRNNVLDSRNELVDGSVSGRSGVLEPRISSRTNMNNSRNSGVQLNALTNTPGKLTSSKSRKAMKSGKTGVSLQDSEGEYSTVETRGGRTSVVSDIKSRQAPSRLSFIEILAEAEERKAKEAKLELEANSSTTTMLRPKTPVLTIDGDVTASPNNVNERGRTSRRGSHIGATPKATAVTIEQD